MKITIYRASSESSGSLIEICSRQARILFDMGHPLLKNGIPLQNFSEFNPDILVVEKSESDTLPPIEGLFHWDKPAFDAVILARVDLDHDNLLRWIHPDIPIWLSAATKALIEQARRFRLIPAGHAEFALFSLERPFTIRDVTIVPLQLDHTFCDVSAFEVQADGRSFIYTGDFHGITSQSACLRKIAAQAGKQSDLLLTDSAMFTRGSAHSRTEEDIEQELVSLLSEPGPFFFQCASHNISRIATFYNACRNTSRQFIIDPFTANVLHELRKLGMSLPSPGVGRDAMHVFSPRRVQSRDDSLEIVDEFRRFSRWRVSRPQVQAMADRVCMLVRPSMLTDLRKMPGLKYGQLVYSMPQRYRETPAQKRLEHLMLARGTTIVPLHTGGHARMSDLEKLIHDLEPKTVRLIGDIPGKLLGQLKKPVEIIRSQETIDL